MAQASEVTMDDAINEPSPAIAFRDVRHRLGPNIVLDQITFNVNPGEWMVLFGESGSGKSTLLRIAAGLERPESGSIHMLGSDQTQRPSHERPIAWMSQTAGCYEHLSLEENLAIAQRLIPDSVRGSSFDVAAWKEELIDRLELRSLLARKPNAISGGERQRAAIARAFLSMRPIMLLDEPLAHLNESMRDRLGQCLREWSARSGATVLYVTHDSFEAASLADRVMVLFDGKIEQIGAPKRLMESPASDRVKELLARLYGGHRLFRKG
ncbi:MAG: ATP-binding cassette domain-containing protein [Pirellula sp.]|nr:ATP-binding cassette domain-containing protein [Pirellula sp.]